MSRAYFPSYIEQAHNLGFTQTGYFTYGDNSSRDFYQHGTTPFHTKQMNDYRNEVLERLKTNRSKDTFMLNGGWRNILPKPQPVGSKIYPFSMTGGKYGDPYSHSYEGGSFRTVEGQQYGRDLVKKRGEQFRELREAVRGNLPMVAQQPGDLSVTLDKSDTNVIAIDLLLSSLSANLSIGAYDRINDIEIQKLFNSFRNIGMQMSKVDLLDYHDKLEESLLTFYTIFNSGIDSSMAKRLTSPYILLYKVFALVKAFISSIDLQPKNRSTFMKSAVIKILNSKDEEDIKNNINALIEGAISKKDDEDDEDDDDDDEGDDDDDDDYDSSGFTKGDKDDPSDFRPMAPPMEGLMTPSDIVPMAPPMAPLMGLPKLSSRLEPVEEKYPDEDDDDEPEYSYEDIMKLGEDADNGSEKAQIILDSFEEQLRKQKEKLSTVPEEERGDTTKKSNELLEGIQKTRSSLKSSAERVLKEKEPEPENVVSQIEELKEEKTPTDRLNKIKKQKQDSAKRLRIINKAYKEAFSQVEDEHKEDGKISNKTLLDAIDKEAEEIATKKLEEAGLTKGRSKFTKAEKLYGKK